MALSRRTPTPILLIDADMLVYRVAAGLEEETDWGDDNWSLHSDARAGKQIVDAHVVQLQNALGATNIRMCFSDPNANFRKGVDKGYKSNRRGQRKPVCYRALVEYCFATYKSLCMPTLEADDILGILATGKHKTSAVMISGDKDLKTVPGRHFHLSEAEGWDDVVFIGPERAHYNHMMQTLCGDTTDGYPGCKGVGPKTAEKALAGVAGNLWSTVLDLFLQKGFDEDFALKQARLARILQHEDVTSGGDVKLWEPRSEAWVPGQKELIV